MYAENKQKPSPHRRLETIRRLTVRLLPGILLLAIVLTTACKELVEDIVHSVSLETKWGQRDEYAIFAPEKPSPATGHWRVGCWSTAFAQILYYHRLTPSGHVDYWTTGDDDCEHTYHIDEDLNYNFDWTLFVNEITPSTPPASDSIVARYIYYTSIVLQKNFGTGDYCLDHADRAVAIATHYNCNIALYDTTNYALSAIKTTIKTEIDADRPVMMHLRSQEDTLGERIYHAVVVDGYATIEDYLTGEFSVHINMGSEGTNDGWYNFDEAILNWGDNSYRKIITVSP